MNPRRIYIVLMLMAAICVAGCAAPAAQSAAAPGAAGTPATPAAPAAASATGSTTVNVAPATQPCCPHETLPQFIGLTGLCKELTGLFNAIRNRLGSVFPGLEAKPPVLAITDPANMNSSNPAVAAAAGAKADEDAAPQKIKAIRYLATLGCAGCYPGIDDALLASLDDCTEEVRYEAAKAFRDLSGRPCSCCKTKSCCSEKVRKKLDEVANKMEHGCYKESSARVRRLCRLALAGCGGGSTPQTPGPQEGPSEGPTPAGKKGATADDSTIPPSPTAGQPSIAQAGFNSSALGGTTGQASSGAPAPTPGAVIQTQSVVNPGCEECGRPASTTTVVSVLTPNPAPTPANAPSNAATSPLAPLLQAERGVGPTQPANAATDEANSLIIKSAGTTPPGSPTQASHVAVVASGNLLAEVNGQGVFESEVLPAADRALAGMAPNVPIEERLRQRPEFIHRELTRAIDRKLICQDARRAGPGVVPASFSGPEADEGAMADAWLKRAIRVDENVSPAELADFYRANQPQFARPAEVRYEMVAARMDRFASREEALAAIQYVRQRASGMATAMPPQVNFSNLEARTFAWTRRESVGSTELADMLFRMPVGATGPALDMGNAWVVVRVLERHSAGIAPLEVAAEAIRQQIVRNRRDYLEAAYVRELRSHAQVWTVFDPPPRAQLTNARPLSDGGQR